MGYNDLIEDMTKIKTISMLESVKLTLVRLTLNVVDGGVTGKRLIIDLLRVQCFLFIDSQELFPICNFCGL